MGSYLGIHRGAQKNRSLLDKSVSQATTALGLVRRREVGRCRELALLRHVTSA